MSDPARLRLTFLSYNPTEMRVEPRKDALQAIQAEVGRTGARETVIRFGRTADVFDVERVRGIGYNGKREEVSRAVSHCG